MDAIIGLPELVRSNRLANIVMEFGPAARWLRAETGVSQPSTKDRGSTDHIDSDSIVGDPVVLAPCNVGTNIPA